VIGAVVLYAARGLIGAQLAQAYLRNRHIPATIVFERLETSGFTAHGALGPADDPDLTVERIAVEFEPIPFLARGLVAPRVRSVLLVRPRLKATLAQGRLKFGSLQPLVDQALAGPGGGPGPTVVVQQGDLRLATPAGVLHLGGEAAMDRGRLTRFAARLQPAALRAGGFSADIAGGVATVVAQGQDLAVALDATAARLAVGGAGLADVRIAAKGALPYPSSEMDGPLRLAATVAARTMTSGETRLANPSLALSLDGLVRGSFETLALQGKAATTVSVGNWRGPGSASGTSLALAGPLSDLRIARSAQGVRIGLAAADLNGNLGPMRAGGLDAAAAKIGLQVHGLDALLAPTKGVATGAPQVRWTTPRLRAAGAVLSQALVELAAPNSQMSWDARGWSLSAPLRLRGRVADLAYSLPQGPFTQRSVLVNMTGDASVGPAPLRLALRGSVRSSGGGASPQAARRLADAVPIIATDPAGHAALERALSALRVDAPALAIDLDRRGPAMRLLGPVALIGSAGGAARLSAPRPGSLALTTGGGGLPEIALDVPAYTVGSDRGGLTLAANGRLKLGFSGSTMTGVAVDLSGRAVRKDGALSVALSGCGPVAMAAFGGSAKPLITEMQASLCSDPGGPMLALGPHDWRLRTRLTGLQFRAPDGDAGVRDASVRLELHADDRSGQPAGGADLLDGRIVDAAKSRRFEALRFSGRAELAQGVWSGPLHLADAAKSRPLAEVRFTHTMQTAAGHADISAPHLVFARDGLQPRDLSPVGADLVSNVEGAVSFVGRADWSPNGLTSSGRLSTEGIDLRSALGPVKRIRTDMTLVSLAPLISAPDQTVSAQEIDWIVPLTTPTAKVSLKADRISIVDATVAAAKGRALLDPIDLPFDPATGVSGVVRLDQIDLSDLIDQFNLADKVTIQATISGQLPFTFAGGAFRLNAGRVFAVGPGRLTIRQEALTGASASAPGAPAPPMQTFAYQAMENLAFDKLEAEVASQPMGRLGVLFRINGRHDPPQGGEARIGLFDLLRGRAFDKPVDLPKGTPVNLVLDTSLNLDEILADYAGRGRSAPVQPASGKP